MVGKTVAKKNLPAPTRRSVGLRKTRDLFTDLGAAITSGAGILGAALPATAYYFKFGGLNSELLKSCGDSPCSDLYQWFFVTFAKMFLNTPLAAVVSSICTWAENNEFQVIGAAILCGAIALTRHRGVVMYYLIAIGLAVFFPAPTSFWPYIALGSLFFLFCWNGPPFQRFGAMAAILLLFMWQIGGSVSGGPATTTERSGR
jgi:hypothetical protein